MLTEHQSRLLSKLIDASWEKDQTSNSYALRDHYREMYYALKRDLKESMGEDAYNEYMSMGAEMFADKK